MATGGSHARIDVVGREISHDDGDDRECGATRQRRTTKDSPAVADEDTDKLTAALAAGDERAVESFYRSYFDWLYEQARRATGRRDESFCLDVVQDALVRVMRTVRRIDSEARFRAWLKLVVQTAACDRLRKERRRRRHELAAAAAAAAEAGFGDRAAERTDSTDAAEQIEWLKREIRRMDPRIAQMIEWRFEQRWTLARISAMLGLSIGTIDGRLRRALRDLRERAAEEFEDDA